MKGKTGLAVLGCGLGFFMVLLDATIVNISIPTMMKSLNTDVSRISWVLDVYMLVLAVLMLTMGRLADQFGRKLLYLSGIGIFMLGSLLCGVSWDANSLIGFRALQAVGGAILLPVSMAIMLALFPAEKRGISMGIWAAIGLVAAAAGPSLGGVLIEYLDWRWIFYINLPIGLIAIALLFPKKVLAESKDPLASKKMDYLGILFSSISVFSLVLAFIQGSDWGWSSGAVIGLFVTTAVFLIAFILVEKWQSQPMMELGLFKNVTSSCSLIGQFIISFCMLGAFIMLTIFLQNVMGYSPLKAALAITPLPGAIIIFAPITGILCDKFGSRVPSLIGMVTLSAGLYLFSLLNGDSSFGDIVWRSVIVGAGLGLSTAGLATAFTATLPAGKEGLGSGVMNMIRQVGCALGVAICVGLISSFIPNRIADAQLEVKSFIMQDTKVSDSIKQNILAGMEKTGQEQQGLQAPPDIGAMAGHMGGPEYDDPQVKQLFTEIPSIFKKHIAYAFRDVLRIVTIVAAAGIIPVLFVRKQRKKNDSIIILDSGTSNG